MSVLQHTEPPESSVKSELVAVVRSAGDWKIISTAGTAGRFEHRVDAEEAALRLALRAQQRGSALSILVQSAAGELVSLHQAS
jgi:hypothetical protein